MYFLYTLKALLLVSPLYFIYDFYLPITKKKMLLIDFFSIIGFSLREGVLLCFLSFSCAF